MVVVTVCGQAGVGRTSVATLLGSRLAERGREFRLRHSDDFDSPTYRQMYALVADTDDDWLVDGTFYRREWQTLVGRLDDELVVVYLTADLETCLTRDRNRAEPLEETAVQVVYHAFDPPQADVTVDTTDQSREETVDEVVTEVESLLKDRKFGTRCLADYSRNTRYYR